MDYKNIVIVGYPKSGTTWISGLVATLVQCPLKGNWWYQEMDSLFTTNSHQDSPYRCYKSHHLGSEITTVSTKPIHKIIYVIRDPRDIVISGMFYFNFVPPLFHFVRHLRLGIISTSLKKMLNRLLPVNSKKQQMIKAVLQGNHQVNEWVSHSWENHIESYRDTDVLFVKYEELLENPQESCRHIVHYLNIEASKDHIDHSIREHSFTRRKKKLQEENSPINGLLRKGVKGSWKTHFTAKETARFKTHFKNKDMFYKF